MLLLLLLGMLDTPPVNHFVWLACQVMQLACRMLPLSLVVCGALVTCCVSIY